MVVIPPKKIYISKSPIHGLGVFASTKIEPNEIIEESPILDIGMKKGEVSSTLIDYRFNYPQGDEWEKQVVGLGYASLYNHSDDANAAWRSNLEKETFEFYAIKEILPGEEIFVYYGDVNYWNDGRTHVHIK